MPADALAPKVTRASAGMVLAVLDRQHVLLFQGYRKISNISHTNSPNLIVPRLVLQLALPNPTKPGVKSRMKM